MAFRCHFLIMSEELENIIQIASEEFRKLLPDDKATGVEIEEIEKHPESGNYLVTLGYWARDNKPRPKNVPPGTVIQLAMGGSSEDLFNPWRRKYKRIEVDPVLGKAIAIRMYEPPLGVS